MIFPRDGFGHKSTGFLSYSNVSIRSAACPEGSSQAISPGLPGTHPSSPLCEILWVHGVLDWKDCNTKMQLESPPASWAPLNMWQILSSQCSTAHQQLKDSSAALSCTVGRGVREAAKLHKSHCREVWGGLQNCGLALNVLNLTGLMITLLTTAE